MRHVKQDSCSKGRENREGTGVCDSTFVKFPMNKADEMSARMSFDSGKFLYIYSLCMYLYIIIYLF